MEATFKILLFVGIVVFGVSLVAWLYIEENDWGWFLWAVIIMSVIAAVVGGLGLATYEV